MPTETIRAAARFSSKMLARKVREDTRRASQKSLGQLVDEMIAAFGTEDAERTRILVLLRMGLPVSR